ncbi:hypothetical protein C8F01DRAFT_1079625 [Mycena amicta]|nr:hypothetical protein C8F01DRAFT_1079625 [Mycena amicta]
MMRLLPGAWEHPECEDIPHWRLFNLGTGGSQLVPPFVPPARTSGPKRNCYALLCHVWRPDDVLHALRPPSGIPIHPCRRRTAQAPHKPVLGFPLNLQQLNWAAADTGSSPLVHSLPNPASTVTHPPAAQPRQPWRLATLRLCGSLRGPLTAALSDDGNDSRLCLPLQAMDAPATTPLNSTRVVFDKLSPQDERDIFEVRLAPTFCVLPLTKCKSAKPKSCGPSTLPGRASLSPRTGIPRKPTLPAAHRRLPHHLQALASLPSPWAPWQTGRRKGLGQGRRTQRARAPDVRDARAVRVRSFSDESLGTAGPSGVVEFVACGVHRTSTTVPRLVAGLQRGCNPSSLRRGV